MIEGACGAGIATTDTLAGGPPSSDLSYVLPSAKSAVSFAVAIDQTLIPPYLMKKERRAFEKECLRVNAMASGIAFHLSNYLRQKGYPSVPVAANCVYRTESAGGLHEYMPDIAHRYLAVRSGVGHMGLSGNIITKDHGAAIILGTTVTTAPLMSTDPLPPEDNYCDKCRLCMASCVSGFMDPKDTARVSLGGIEVAYSKRRHYGRCDCVCSGYTGLHSSRKWSTWSPGRFALPERDDELLRAQDHLIKVYAEWPEAPGGRFFILADDKLRTSCGNCQIICCPDKNERTARFKMLTKSGVVVQHPDGALEAVSPRKAEELLAHIPPRRRSLYEKR